MRMMLKVLMPVEKGSQSVQSGNLSKIMTDAVKDLKPEAAYFYPEKGKRACLMVFDMMDSSQIPMVAERFFIGLDGEVTLTPVMNADDLKRGLEAMMSAKAMA